MTRYHYFYDIEVFPNLFAVEFKSYRYDIRKVFVVWTDGQSFINQIKELCAFVRHEAGYLIGYNSKEYDDEILHHILMKEDTFRKGTVKLILNSIKELSDKIINSNDRMFFKRKTTLFNSVDLILMFNRIDRVSLKQIAVNLKWPLIQDLPYAPGTFIDEKKRPLVLKYLTNDVNITEALLERKLVQQFNERIAITKSEGVDVVNLSETDMAKQLLKSAYAEATGLKYAAFKNLRTPRKRIKLEECISKKVKMITREGNRLINELTDKTIIPKDAEEDEKETFNSTFYSKHLVHDLGLGGIHSRNKPSAYLENDKFIYWDVDVVSYYPRIIAEEGLFPAHLGPKFTEVYANNIFWPRVAAKKAGNDVKAGFLKIAANATFGLTRSKYSWLYDHKMGVTICITGQLFLIMLIEWLETYSDCKVIYSNTDGLTVRIPVEEQALFFEICNRWQRHTKMELEYTKYKRMFFRDVNNYLIETYDEKKPHKSKGCFVPYGPVTKGYCYPVVALALQNYFLYDMSIEETVMADTDIYDFLLAERTSTEKFTVTHKDMAGRITTMQKNNRWIVTDGEPGEGTLYKTSIETKEVTNMHKGYMVYMMNNIPKERPFMDYKLNFDYYILEALNTATMIRPLDNRKIELINPVRVEQGMLFS